MSRQCTASADMHADVAGRLCDRARLGRKVGQALHARIVRHGRADAAARDAAERHRRGEPGIDRRDEREIRQPGLERHVEAADLAQPHHPRVVVRIGERGQHEPDPLPAPSSTAAMRPSTIVIVRSAAAGSAASGMSQDAAMRWAVTALSPAITERAYMLSLSMRASFGGRKLRSNTSFTAGALASP